MTLSETPGTAAHQAPLPMGFPRQEHWSGLPFPSPGDLPDPGIQPGSPASAGGFFTTEPPGKPPHRSKACFRFHNPNVVLQIRHIDNKIYTTFHIYLNTVFPKKAEL